MMLKEFLYFFLLVYVCDVNAELQLSEVLNLINSTEPRSEIPTTEKFSLISMSFADCEFDETNTKVFCSDFVGIVDTQEQDPDIDIHKNIGLLPKVCGENYENRFNKNLYPKLYEFPWMALISYVVGTHEGHKRYQFKCSGTVISSRYILTAAHCVAGKSIAGVRVGDFNYNKKMDCQDEYSENICEDHVQDITVEKAIVHDGFIKLERTQNNIALLRLKTPIDFSYKNARPVCLPINDRLRNVNLDGKMATIAGWGMTVDSRIYPDIRKDYVPIKSEIECKLYYDNASTPFSMDGKFCAGKQGQQFCWLLGGSPLMLEDEYNEHYRMIQYGITSFGSLKCNKKPDVYTDVRKFIIWILDNIEE